MRRFSLPIFCSLVPCLCSSALAEEPVVDTEPVAPKNWKVSIGIFYNGLSNNKSDTSRDNIIAESSQSESFVGKLDAEQAIDKEKTRFEHDIELRYGQQSQDDEPMRENQDRIDYDAVLKFKHGPTFYTYAGGGIESVFTGPEPEKDPFDPTWLDVSVGLGYNAKAKEDTIAYDIRIGAGGRTGNGDSLTEDEKDFQGGIEGRFKYDQSLHGELITIKLDYETFAPFDDMGNHWHRVKGTMRVNITKILKLDLEGRAYYEAAPEDALPTDLGYDEWSSMLSTQIGLAYEF